MTSIAVEEIPEPSLRRIALAAAATVLVSFGGFLGWSLVAALDSAVVATGTVVVQTHRKTVSSLEGGILRDLLVREGEVVAAGQPLLRLDPTQALADVGQLTAQNLTARARAARLTAEQAERRELTMPDTLREAAARDPAAATMVETERRLFAARWQAYDSTIAIQRKKIAQITDTIAAIDADQASVQQRLRYYNDELAGVQSLYSKGFQTKPHLLE